MDRIPKAIALCIAIISMVSASMCMGPKEDDDGMIDVVPDLPVEKNGVLVSDETWSGTIIIQQFVNVPKGVTLTIEPGTRVLFKHYRGYKEPWLKGNLQILGGTLKAVGTPASRIWFTSDAQDPINGDWNAITIRNSNSSIISYSVIEFAVLGVLQFDSSVEVSHSIVRWINTEGLYAERSTPRFLSNIMYGNGYHDIALEQYNKDVVIEGNHFLGGHVSLHFEKTAAKVENNYITGYRTPMTGGMDSVLTIKGNRIRDFKTSSAYRFDPTVKTTMTGNDLGDDSVPIPPLDIIDVRDKELKYIPGDPEDLFNYVYDPEDETRIVTKRIGEGLSFGWSLLFHKEYLWRFSIGHGTIGKQLDLIRIDPNTGDHIRYGNDVIMNPRGLTSDGEYFYVNDFSLLKIFKFQINGTMVEILDSFYIPEKEKGGTSGLTFDGTYLRLVSRDGGSLHTIQKDGILVETMTFRGGSSFVGSIVWTGDCFWTAYGGPKGLGKWDRSGNLFGSIYPAADGTWAIAWDGRYIWTIQRTCEEWNDDKIFRIEVLDDSLGVDVPPG